MTPLDDLFRRSVGVHLTAFIGTRQPLLWLLAFVVGLAVSGATILFHYGVGWVQWLWLGTTSDHMLDVAAAAPWWVVIAGPTVGGLVVGLYLQRVHPGQRTAGLADVVEARASGKPVLAFWPGVGSAFATIVSLGAGASAGREGPIVHLGGVIATKLGEWRGLGSGQERVLLAAGAASAIAGSFNTPIAGVLFAHEVILGHYGLTAFVPTVIAATTAVIPARLLFGEAVIFDIDPIAIESYSEFPAFAILGLAAGVVAVLFQWTLVGTDVMARKVPMPLWCRPVAGGLLVGAIGVAMPEVLGIGAEAMDRALHTDGVFLGLLLILAAKMIATAITLASRFGGGIVFPSLYLGALTGSAFGAVAASVAPDLASPQPLYAILGMGAVAAAVLGAPVSTAVMVFELTGGFQLSIALLLTVAIATATNQALHGRSLIQWQLEMRGILLQSGPQRHLMRTLKVAAFMTPALPKAKLPADYPSDSLLAPGDTLAHALKLFDFSGRADLAVAEGDDPERIVGWASHVSALRALNDAMAADFAERHR
ncbi:chloride channel protein [Chthonobacter rhizosphaerae]|uniref:chloride channel protein n=1 Tax=Chthonobacter rhizosphaerae TaxID=2735553 RepID=UPI0015EF75F5|nr:chloride channel protein [Chthonobacter rhizosphaerae]